MKENQMTREEFQELVRELADAPRVVRQVADRLTNDDSRWKPTSEEWSVLEHLCHLRDIEQEGYTVRIEKLRHETEPLLADIDGDRLAFERSYNSQDFEQALRAFTEARRQNVEALKDLPLEHLNHSGRLETVGPVTLGKLLLMMREHDQGHLQDISSLRKRLRRSRAPLTAAG
ncbi:MAG TPA: DinB family protein [Pyrinomonadaceae bacterium]|jgi:uncharacterized damage-inducible protein DinB